VQHHVERQDIADPTIWARDREAHEACAPPAPRAASCRHSRVGLRFAGPRSGPIARGNEAAALWHRRTTVKAGERDRVLRSSLALPALRPAPGCRSR
jgi:hypothetical protein